MANNQENLIGHGFDERTAEEQRKIAKAGGIASGEARRKKRDLRLAIEALLEKDIKAKDGTMLSGAEAIAVKQFEKALKGDPKAFELLRDTSGQKPVEKVMIAEVDQNIIDEVEKAILDDED